MYIDDERDILHIDLDYFDYMALPEAAWYKLLIWYGLADGSRPIARRVMSCKGSEFTKVQCF